MSAQQLTRLNLYESMPVVPVQVFDVGSEVTQIASYGNSLLSTLWVKDVEAGASVLVKWYDVGPGSGDFPGEKIYVAQHAVISTADTSDRRLVPGIHNKVWCEIIVTGGKVTLGIYATSVSAFPQYSPFRDEDIANLGNDSGNPSVLLDRDLGKWFLATGKEGAANVNVTGGSVSAEMSGDPKVIYAKELTTGLSQTLINTTVPATKLWKIRKIYICSRCYGEFYIKVNSVIIGEGKTSPVETNVSFSWIPYFKAPENIQVEVLFKQSYGPILDVSASLQLTEELLTQ